MSHNITKWDNRFLDLAKFVSTWSKDPSTQVGAIITNGIKIVSMGFNGLPMGVLDTDKRLKNRKLKYKLIVHAELNAIIFSERSIAGCSLFLYPFLSCSQCTSIIIQSGIKRVVSIVNDNPRWIESIKLSEKMYQEAGVEVCLYPQLN